MNAPTVPGRGRSWSAARLLLMIAGSVGAAAMNVAEAAAQGGRPVERETVREAEALRVTQPRLFERRVAFTPTYLRRIFAAARIGERAEERRAADAAYYASRYGISEDLARAIVDSAIAEGIDPELGFRIVRVESVFEPNARGRYGALGLTQLMPATARSIDRSLRTEAQILEPVTNLRTGFRYLRMMIERYEGDVRLGLLAYNRGLGTVDRALRAGRDPENGYSPKVLGGSGSQYTGKGIIKDEGR